MTNGEKIQAVFPDIEMWGDSKDTLDYSLGGMIHRVTKSWWNAKYKERTTESGISNKSIIYKAKESKEIQEDLDKLSKLNESTTKNCESCRYYGSHHEVCKYCYKCSLWTNKEPTTQNDLVQERYQDLIEYFYGKEVAKTILEDRKEFKAWLERLRWNVNRADELARESEQIKGTTKNDIGVDCISREAVERIINKWLSHYDYELKDHIYSMTEKIHNLPSVTPLSSGLEKNSKKLEKDFGESDCISRADVNQVIEDYMDEQYHVLSDRTRERAFGAKAVMARINELDPVTPIRPKGHWIGQKKIGFGEWKECIVSLKDGFVTDSCSCSECGDWLTGSDEYQCSGNFCPNCGADMREIEEC